MLVKPRINPETIYSKIVHYFRRQRSLSLSKIWVSDSVPIDLIKRRIRLKVFTFILFFEVHPTKMYLAHRIEYNFCSMFVILFGTKLILNIFIFGLALSQIQTRALNRIHSKIPFASSTNGKS